MSTAEDVRAALLAHADPSKAAAMQAYMKSGMPFLGIQKKQRTQALSPILRRTDWDRQSWLATAGDLWDNAQLREHRYAALAVLRFRPFWQSDDVDFLHHLIVTGAWWDYVDEIAAHMVRTVLSDEQLRAWAHDDDKWIRRASILSQLRLQQTTDRRLLADCIEPNLGDREFFIAKAIGWALRDFARVDPGWVRDFVDSHPDLAPLSAREATKHL